MTSLCPRCLQTAETNAHIYCCSNQESVKQRKADWAELLKQLRRLRTSHIIIRAWSTHLLPLLCIPPLEDISSTIPVIDVDINYMLQYAIQDQNDIGWDKLLLSLSSSLWKSLQSGIDSYNPKAWQRTAEDWLNQSLYHLIKFSMRCWKARNAAVHGTTRKEQHDIALANARSRIQEMYASPPALDPQFRPISDVPLARRLRLPLQAAEQWLSLVHHQIKVTKHNLTVLLKPHVPIPIHVKKMQQYARRQRYERRQPVTQRKAHSRAVQADAVKTMKACLYAPKRQGRLHTRSILPPRLENPSRTPSARPNPRYHPP